MLKVVQQNFRHNIYAGDAVARRLIIREKVTHRITNYVLRQGEEGAAISFASEILLITDLPTTTFDLEFTPKANSLRVFLNGIRERHYTLTGSTVDFAAITELMVGDEFTFDYAY